MPMSTPSGESSYKFDMVVSDDVKRAMNETQNQVKDITCEVKEYEKKIHDELDAVRRTFNGELTRQANTITSFESAIVIDETVLYTFMRSKFVRFLNFFAQWFIYMDNGQILPNTKENTQFGKSPVLTRIREWFKNHFPE